MSNRLSPLQTDEILRRSDMVAVIGEYLQLKQAGRHFKGLCPFHSEKTPSFVVSPDKGMWHCFGCGEGGSLFTFLMKVESLSFPEAVRRLAERAGMTLDLSPREARELSERDALIHIMERAVTFYRDTLAAAAGQAGRRYLEQRGITQETINAFHIGYAPDGGNALVGALGRFDVRPEELERAGLALCNKERGSYYDYFRHRIIVPIFDSQGRPVALGGRVLDEGQPKYLNGPDTLIFSKGRTLFALHQAKHTIAKMDEAVLVEGYLDAIGCHQAGAKHVVASLGTALTAQQAGLLARYARKAVLAYDPDIAGVAAAERAIGVLEEAGITAMVASLPPGEDPDTFLRAHGLRDFQRLLVEAQGPVDFKMGLLERRHALTAPEGKADFLRELVPFLQRLKDPLRRDEYLRRVAAKLGVREEAVRQAVRSAAGGGGDRRRGIAGIAGSAEDRGGLARLFRGAPAEEQLVHALLHRPGLIPQVKRELAVEAVSSVTLRQVLEALYRVGDGQEEMTASLLTPHLQDEGLMAQVAAWLLSPPLASTDEAVAGLVRRIQEQRLSEELQQCLVALAAKENPDRNDPNFVRMMQLTQRLKGSRIEG